MRSRALSLAVLLGVLLWPVGSASAASFREAVRGVRKYVIINLLLATADYESARAVQHPGGCTESNPLFNHYPSRPRFYGEGLAIDAGPELLGWLLHRKHARLWQTPYAVVAAWHAQGLISNLRCSGMHP